MRIEADEETEKAADEGQEEAVAGDRLCLQPVFGPLGCLAFMCACVPL